MGQQVDIRKSEVGIRDRFRPRRDADQKLVRNQTKESIKCNYSEGEMGFIGCEVCDDDSKAQEEARGRAKATNSMAIPILIINHHLHLNSKT